MFTQHIKNYSQNVGFNTFIGGIAKLGGTGANSVINTKALLAYRLQINPNKISNFRIIDEDVKCRIKGGYNLSTDLFKNNKNLTHYLDVDSLCKRLNHETFFGCNKLEEIDLKGLEFIGKEALIYTNLVDINLPNLTSASGTYGSFRLNSKLKTVNLPNLTTCNWGVSGFDRNPSLELVNTPKLKKFRNVYTSEMVFTLAKIGFTLNMHEGCLTSNSGGLDFDVAFALTNREAIVNLYDDAGNYVSTL